MSNTTTRTRAARQSTRRTTSATVAARQEAAAYTIHSLDEYQIDTRVTRSPALTAEQARNLTTEIQHTMNRLWLLVTEAHDRKAHLALGYDTWADYAKAELNMSESRTYQYLDTGHVMKALAASGVDIEDFSPPPVRVIARVKDRLTDVKKVAAQAIREAEGDPTAAVDKAIRALAREPRKGGNGNGGGASSAAGAAPQAEPTRAAEAAPKADDTVPCPACAGTGRVTKAVEKKLLDLLRKLK